MTDDATSDAAMEEPSVEADAESKPILEPEEIEALVASVAPGETVEALFATLPPLKQLENAKEFTFDSGVSDGPGRYPLFVNLQERMAEALKEQWSDTFSRDVVVSFKDMDEVPYSDVINTEEPQVFFAYSVEGFGKMMLSFDLPLIVAHVDAMLGGTGESYGEKILTLSPVERNLSERIAQSLEMHLENAWKPVTILDFVLFKIDTDPQFLAVASSYDACFSMRFEIQLDDDVKGMFALHYPRTFLEPMLDNLRSTMSDEPTSVDKDWEQRLKDSLHHVPITMRLEMGRCHMNIGQFLNLSPGDYLPLKVAESEPSTLWVDKTPMFQAKAGSQDGLLAAELIQEIHGGAS